MSFRATVLTLYPEMFPGHLGQSLAGRALARGDAVVEAVNIRDFAHDRHRSVDDTPAGGGAGMVLRPDVLAAAIDAVSPADDPRPLADPDDRAGPPLDPSSRAQQLAARSRRADHCLSARSRASTSGWIRARNLEEISIGDYVLLGRGAGRRSRCSTR